MIHRWFFLILVGSCLTIKAELPAKSTVSQPTAEPAYFKTGILTLQDRIWAQTQIERVWYNPLVPLFDLVMTTSLGRQ
jgi:hypothetical protein